MVEWKYSVKKLNALHWVFQFLHHPVLKIEVRGTREIWKTYDWKTYNSKAEASWPSLTFHPLLFHRHAEDARSEYSLKHNFLPFFRSEMSSKYIIGILGAVGTAFIGYCVYFDRKRRSDPHFKEKLRESKWPLLGRFIIVQQIFQWRKILK